MEIASGLSYLRPTPTFSFHSIVDEDISLLSYVIANYYDTSVFDFSSILNTDFFTALKYVYNREMINPLRLFMVEGADEKFVDECYEELISTREEEVLEYGIITKIPTLIRMFKDSGGMNPSIFYYNDIQREALEDIEELEDIQKIEFNKVLESEHKQIFINYYTEAEKLTSLRAKTIYMSTKRFNVIALQNFQNNPYLTELVGQFNKFSIYDLYSNIIEYEAVYNDGEEEEDNDEF